MQASFEYMHQTVALDSLDVEDTGNCCLNVLNDRADEWYLTISTDLGWTTIIQFGPLTADMDELQNSFYISRNKVPYNEKLIHKTIYNFLNDDKKSITQAILINSEVAIDRLRGVIDGSGIY